MNALDKFDEGFPKPYTASTGLHSKMQVLAQLRGYFASKMQLLKSISDQIKHQFPTQ